MSGIVLGFDEDDGDVIDFDNDGEVDLHKWVSRHFLFTNINFYRSRVHIRVLTWNQSGGKAEAPVKAGGAPPPPPGPTPPPLPPAGAHQERPRQDAHRAEQG